MSEQEQIEAGHRVREFLRDPVIAGALEAAEQAAFRAFKSARSREEVEAAHARAVALDAFATELHAVIASGEYALAVRNRREKGLPTP